MRSKHLNQTRNNAGMKDQNRPKISRRRQEILFESIKQDVADEPLGSLLQQMDRLVKGTRHQAAVAAIVKQFNESTEEMPSNYVALAAVRIAWQAITNCLFIAGVITEGRGKKEIKVVMDQYRRDVESVNQKLEKETGLKIPRKVSGPRLVQRRPAATNKSR